MISYKTGDVIKAFISGEVSTFIHQANCQNTMQSGIAKQVKFHLPELYAADQRTLKGSLSKLGTCSHTTYSIDTTVKLWGQEMPGSMTLLGINLYGQYAYGLDVQHTNYTAIRKGLRQARAIIEAYNLNDLPIGLPKIGCGRGGGDWDVVRDILCDTIGDLDVVVYTLEEK